MTRPTISLIAAMAKNRVIGNKGDIPWHIPEDFKYFKAQTLGKPIIMGRTTFESIHNMRGTDPASGPALTKRDNIIITRQASYNVRETRLCHSLDDALSLAESAYNANEIMICGGGQIYTQSMDLVDRMYLTIIDKDYDGDAYFPAFNLNEWILTSSDPQDGYTFNVYDRAKP